MIKRILKIFIGAFLFPVCIGTTRAFFELLTGIAPLIRTELFFLAGIITYLVFYFSSLKLTFLYVLGHETTHAFFSVLCGGAVKSFKVSTKGGSVATTKSNTLVSLGPYFFPIYTILLAVGFFITGLFYRNIYNFSNAFLFLVGFSISFHFVMTLDSLRTEQPDLSGNGYLFSLTLMYLINIIVLGGILSAVFKEANILLFFKNSALATKSILVFIWGVIVQVKESGGV